MKVSKGSSRSYDEVVLLGDYPPVYLLKLNDS